MPYLHWETDRRRSKFDEIIRNITEEYKEKENRRLAKARSKSTTGQAAPAANQNGRSKSVVSQLPAEKKHSFWPWGKRNKAGELIGEDLLPMYPNQRATKHLCTR